MAAVLEAEAEPGIRLQPGETDGRADRGTRDDGRDTRPARILVVTAERDIDSGIGLADRIDERGWGLGARVSF